MTKTIEMVNRFTKNGTLRFAQLRFSSWTHDINEVYSILESQGYIFTRSGRHHAVINATKMD